MTTRTQREVNARPAAIESAFTDLWRERAEGGQGGAKARLATLVSVCRSDAEADMAGREVAALNSTRPVRSIIVSLRGAGEPRAVVELRCDESSRGVCYEEVTLKEPVSSAGGLPSLLGPLTVPDLPVYLWFPGDLTLDEILLEHLFAAADRVVTDSHSFADPLDRFRRIHGWIVEHRGDTVFTEMTWTRLGTWREAIGKLFDPSDSRAFLADVKGVEIRSSHGSGSPSDRALLIMGWLATKLGWAPLRWERGDELRAWFASAAGEIPVTIVEGTAAARGHLLGVHIDCGDVSFQVDRLHGDASGAIRTCITCSGEEAERPAYNPLHWSASELLCNALEIRSPFADWEDALAAIAGLEG
ncbi:MAG TPA: glucose-6-phosphate dehydrogenase assembly protein OpcA [Armatimonadota bacterium]|jgi:glucose-6-phosphate dehydrogenase assembly protein OpcA